MSSKNGDDSKGCGSEEHPCKTIEHAVKIGRRDMELFLHGGSKWIYNITSTLFLNFNTNIRKHGKAIGNPLIYCTTDKLFKLSYNLNFQLDSVNIFGTKDKLSIISLKTETFTVGIGNISVSSVTVTATNSAQIELVSLVLYQTLETITISSSHIQGVLVKVSSASYICRRNIVNVTIIKTTAHAGTEMEGGNYDFDNIIIKDSFFDKNILSFQNAKITINHVAILKTYGENGMVIKDSSIFFDNPFHTPQNTLPNNQLSKLAVIEKENSTGTYIGSFAVYSSTITKILKIHDMYPVNDTINFAKIEINKSICDMCIVSEASVTNIHLSIIRNTKIQNNLIDVFRGELAIQEFAFLNNQIQRDSKAIYFQSSRDDKEKIILKNGIIEWNVDGNEKPLIDVKEAPLTAEIVNVTITTSSTKEFKAIWLEEKRLEYQGLINVTILCSSSSNISPLLRTGLKWFSMRLRCKPCKHKTYSLDSGSLHITAPLSHPINNLNNQSEKVTCHKCPPGGRCEYGLKSDDNYFGYKNITHGLEFTYCPAEYCCELDECKNYTSCRANRTGFLCGQCVRGYQENFFNIGCVEIIKCKPIIWFWLFLLLSTVVTVLGFGFTKEIVEIAGHVKDAIAKVVDKINICSKEEEEEKEESKKLTISAAFNIIVGFYQMKKLIAIKLSKRYDVSEIDIQAYIMDFFNLEIFIKASKTLCPIVGLNPISKGVIKSFLMPVIMFSQLWIALIVHGICFCFGNRRIYHFERPMTWGQRIGLTFIKLLIFNYKAIGTFCVILVNCVQINNSSLLFIYADMECFQWWQKTVMVFLGVWVIPFPAALMASYYMLLKRSITFKEFILCTILPVLVLFYYLRAKDDVISDSTERMQRELIANLREFFEEPYRRINGTDDSYVFWESWRLYQRLILVMVTTFSIHPIVHACGTTMVIALFIFVFAMVNPYKEELYALRLMEITGLAGLSLALGEVMFNAYVYNLQIPKNSLKRSLQILGHLNVAITPIYALIFVYAGEPLIEKVRNFRWPLRGCLHGRKLSQENEGPGLPE